MFTLNLLRHPGTITLLTALALGACELPAKVGDLPEDETGADTEPSATGTSGDKETTTGDATTGDATTGEEPGETTGDPTDNPAGCQALAEDTCGADPKCQPLYGERLISEGCKIGEKTFVVCHDAGLECDQAESIVCDDEGGYKISVTCEIPGIEACTPMCGDNECEGLDEASCEANVGCKPVHGHPHVAADDTTCVDTDVTAYLGCLPDTGECPPFIPTVCPEGVSDEPYDVPSGCIPPHFETCGRKSVKECE